MWVLGINWRFHDASAALVDGDGVLWAFAEEERFTRVKHAYDTLPTQAARHCLAAAGISWRDLDAIAVGWDLEEPERRRDYLEALFGPEVRGHKQPEFVCVEHHLSHALASYHASGFSDAGVLVVDGSGEHHSISIFAADSTGLTLKRAWDRRYSLGALYEATTRALGFGVLADGKTMGLSSYADASSVVDLPILDPLSDVRRPDCPVDMDPALRYDKFVENGWMRYFEDRFGRVATSTDQIHRDAVAVAMAGSAQHQVEQTMRALLTETVSLSRSQNVCLSGGVALNCVANGRLPEPLYVPPFPHDGGVAVGAAWYVCPPKNKVLLASPYLGTEISNGAATSQLRDEGYTISDFTPETVIEALLDGHIGAIAQGRAEIGPRALGHRSIIALPRPAEVRDRLNALKRREVWRPFAPVTLPDYASRLWPSQGTRELYMVGNAVTSSHARQIAPAAVHVDGTTRPQVVHADGPGALVAILQGLDAISVPPVLINTSFNDRGEPLVNSEAEAVAGFHRLGLDFLILGDKFIKNPRRDSAAARPGSASRGVSSV